MAGRARQSADSIVRGGLVGILLVTLATIGLSAAAAVVALVVSLLF